ncbi:hypothetical protein [Nocardioides sp. GY 10113]|uniref:hypothetical protein n=1 Tax=Nocardioides sp. GY 10113 TaxID=2569761 RepID=UPI0014586B32|nr:hypothetical protein [Nocardioides sp. GY 10113]
MHVADQLYPDQFAVSVDGEEATPEDLFPGWTASDRYGVVVREPLGALGAGLLTQLAIALFYDVRPERRSRRPTYPDVYVFHVGGPHGDCSHLDLWPPRREVRLPAGDPLALLEAVNAHAITRLALPDGPRGDLGSFRDGPSTWAEEAAAADRLRSCFRYGAAGAVADPDVRLEATDARVHENLTATLHPLASAIELREAVLDGESVALPGPSVPADILRWVGLVERRQGEVPAWFREVAAREHAERAAGGLLVQTYGRVSVPDALARLAAC